MPDSRVRCRVRRLVVLAAAASLALTAACGRTPIEPPPPACAYAVEPTALTFGASGGTSPVAITTLAGCPWTTQTGSSWLSIAGAAVGTGPASVAVNAAPNTATTPRTGTVTIATRIVTVEQAGGTPCSYAIDPTSATVSALGGTGTVAVSAPAHCPWTASSDRAWLRITAGASASGDAVVMYAADPNPDPAARNGQLTIAGLPFTVSQAGDMVAADCTYTVAPVTVESCMAWTVDAMSTVTTQDGCAWNAAASEPWLTIVDGHSGVGSGTIRFRGTDNWRAPRTGLVMVRWPTVTAGQNISVAQAGCLYGVSTSSFDFAPSGGTASFMVVQQSDPITCGGPLQDRCLWSAESDVGWITVTTPMPRTGDDSVTFIVAANPGTAPRMGSITVRDRVVRITQAGN